MLHGSFNTVPPPLHREDVVSLQNTNVYFGRTITIWDTRRGGGKGVMEMSVPHDLQLQANTASAHIKRPNKSVYHIG